jgi:hypothetical protein
MIASEVITPGGMTIECEAAAHGINAFNLPSHFCAHNIFVLAYFRNQDWTLPREEKGKGFGIDLPRNSQRGLSSATQEHGQIRVTLGHNYFGTYNNNLVFLNREYLMHYVDKVYHVNHCVIGCR